MSDGNRDRERRMRQPVDLTPGTLPDVNSLWQNVHTGDVERVKRVGPCANLDGEIRIWLDSEIERQWPGNGSSVSEFARCWRRADSVQNDEHEPENEG